MAVVSAGAVSGMCAVSCRGVAVSETAVEGSGWPAAGRTGRSGIGLLQVEQNELGRLGRLGLGEHPQHQVRQPRQVAGLGGPHAVPDAGRVQDTERQGGPPPQQPRVGDAGGPDQLAVTPPPRPPVLVAGVDEPFVVRAFDGGLGPAVVVAVAAAFAFALLPAGDLVLAGAEERADVDGVAAQQDALGGGERFQGGVPGRQNARCGATGGLGGCPGSLATERSARYPAPPVNVRTPCASNAAATVTGSTGRPDTDSARIAAKISRCPS